MSTSFPALCCALTLIAASPERDAALDVERARLASFYALLVSQANEVQAKDARYDDMELIANGFADLRRLEKLGREKLDAIAKIDAVQPPQNVPALARWPALSKELIANTRARAEQERDGRLARWKKSGGKPPPSPLTDLGLVDHSPARPVGEQLFEDFCERCHRRDGEARVGDAIRGLYGRGVENVDGSVAIVDDAFVRESLLAPGKRITRGYVDVMPAFDRFTEAQMTALLAWLAGQR